jgi:hypothetical protein
MLMDFTVNSINCALTMRLAYILMCIGACGGRRRRRACFHNGVLVVVPGHYIANIYEAYNKVHKVHDIIAILNKKNIFPIIRID